MLSTRTQTLETAGRKADALKDYHAILSSKAAQATHRMNGPRHVRLVEDTQNCENKYKP